MYFCANCLLNHCLEMCSGHWVSVRKHERFTLVLLLVQTFDLWWKWIMNISYWQVHWILEGMRDLQIAPVDITLRQAWELCSSESCLYMGNNLTHICTTYFEQYDRRGDRKGHEIHFYCTPLAAILRKELSMDQGHMDIPVESPLGCRFTIGSRSNMTWMNVSSTLWIVLWWCLKRILFRVHLWTMH